MEASRHGLCEPFLLEEGLGRCGRRRNPREVVKIPFRPRLPQFLWIVSYARATNATGGRSRGHTGLFKPWNLWRGMAMRFYAHRYVRLERIIEGRLKVERLDATFGCVPRLYCHLQNDASASSRFERLPCASLFVSTVLTAILEGHAVSLEPLLSPGLIANQPLPQHPLPSIDVVRYRFTPREQFPWATTDSSLRTSNDG